MNHRQPHRVGDRRLGDRDAELLAVGQPAHTQPRPELQEQVGDAFAGAATADADQVLGQDLLLARGGPRERGREARRGPHHLEQNLGLEAGDRQLGQACHPRIGVG